MVEWAQPKTVSKGARYPNMILILFPFHFRTWFGHLGNVLDRHPNEEVIVLDISRYMWPTGESIATNIPLFGTRHRLARHLRKMNVPLIELKSYSRSYTGAASSDGPENSTDFMALSESHLFTLFRTQFPERVRFYRAFLSRMIRLNRRFEQDFQTYLETLERPKLVYVPSGRNPVPRIAASQLVREKVKIKYFENGWLRDGTYFSDWPTHSREFVGQEFSLFEPTVSQMQTAEDFLARRTRFGGSDFSYRHNNSDLRRQFDYVYFTSSIDEFHQLGEDWETNWRDQYEAYLMSLTKFDPTGERSALRVHPNLRTKHPVQIAHEMEMLENFKQRMPLLTIFDHESTVNSYKLLESSKVCFVFRSTISLEAVYMGKKVVSMAPNYFTEPLEIPVITGPSELKSFDISSLEPGSPDAALRFMSYLKSRTTPWGSLSRQMFGFDPVITGGLRLSAIPNRISLSQIIMRIGPKRIRHR